MFVVGCFPKASKAIIFLFDFLSNFRNVANLINYIPLKTPHSMIHPGLLEDSLNNS